MTYYNTAKVLSSLFILCWKRMGQHKGKHSGTLSDNPLPWSPVMVGSGKVLSQPTFALVLQVSVIKREGTDELAPLDNGDNIHYEMPFPSHSSLKRNRNTHRVVKRFLLAIHPAQDTFLQWYLQCYLLQVLPAMLPRPFSVLLILENAANSLGLLVRCRVWFRGPGGRGGPGMLHL